MDWLDSIRETWMNPNMRHAAIVHLPVALGVLGAALTVLFALGRGRRAGLRWIVVAWYVLLALSAWAATQSGEAAEDALKRNLVTAARDLIHEHEELAEKVWLLALATAAALLVTAVTRPIVRSIATVLAVLLALTTAGWIGATAHHGGAAVYRHGAGTQSYETTAPATSSSTTSASGPESSAAGDPRRDFFRTRIAPIIESRCLRCHSGGKPKAGLDQSTVAGLLKGGRSGPAILPGQPRQSLMYLRITNPDDDMAMPPDGRLPIEQIAAIEQWISDGAVGE